MARVVDARGPEAEGEPLHPGRVTEALEELRQGSPGAREEFFRLVYGELRRVASAHMRRQPPHHTLQPTALIHETYLRMMGGADPQWNDSAHFFNAAARAMRSILVDHARAKRALKRGGEGARITFDESGFSKMDPSQEVIAVHDALAKLESIDPLRSRIVELRFFGGLSVEETARVMDISRRSAFRVWEHARAWLYREIGS